jgi:hypothetical protein
MPELFAGPAIEVGIAIEGGVRSGNLRICPALVVAYMNVHPLQEADRMVVIEPEPPPPHPLINTVAARASLRTIRFSVSLQGICTSQ